MQSIKLGYRRSSKRKAPSRRKQQGSVTVEASLELPLVIIVCFAFIMFFQLLMIQVRLQSALEELADELAMAGYVQELIPEGTGGDSLIQSLLIDAAVDIAEMSVGEAYVQLRMPSKIDEAWLDKTMLAGGSQGISYIISPLALEAGIIDLRAYYEYRFPGFTKGITFCQRVYRKEWNGLTNIAVNNSGGGGDGSGSDQSKPDGTETSETQEKQVYVTKEGSVYHLYRDCRVLKRNIKSGSLSSMEDKRNDSGGKYYICGSCVHGSANMVVYYTKDGDRYHNSISCGSLVRYISQTGISQVNGLPLCKFCASRSLAGDEDILEGL